MNSLHLNKRIKPILTNTNTSHTYWSNAEREFMLLKNSGSQTIPENNNKITKLSTFNTVKNAQTGENLKRIF